jgi:hypothetical protein
VAIMVQTPKTLLTFAIIKVVPNGMRNVTAVTFFYLKLHLSPVFVPLSALLFPLMLLFMLSCDTGCHLILTLLFLLTYVFSF